MASVNRVTLLGNLGADPIIRSTPNGTKVANLSLATSHRSKDSNGQQKDSADWHRVVLWSKAAEISEQYLRKGSQLYVEGELRTRSWTDRTGTKRYTTEVVGRRLQLLGKADRAEEAPPAMEDPPVAEPEEQEDIPF